MTMSTVVHVSDLHFGPKHNPHLSELVLGDIRELEPDLVILSGDFTLRGRMSEYEQAHAYIERIPAPVLSIPGNHDQPLHPSALFERLGRPMKRYQRFIHGQTDTTFARGDLFVVGLNDNRPILPGGFWSGRQRRWIANELAGSPRDAYKIIVTHHHLIWVKPRPLGVWNAAEKLAWLARQGVELVLNGHTHVPLARKTPQGPVIAQAGTAMSARVRQGHGNSYNLIHLSVNEIKILVRRYVESADRFQAQEQFLFPREMTRVAA